MAPLALPLVLSLALAPAIAEARCLDRYGLAELEYTLERAEATFEVDVLAFEESTLRMVWLLECLDAPVTPAIAARVHRVEGLQRHHETDPGATVRAFAAARALEPDVELDTIKIRAKHPVHAEYAALNIDRGRSEEVRLPESGGLLFDGQPGVRRPLSWPTIVQLVDADEKTLSTTYLWPGQDMPEYAPVRSVRAAVLDEESATRLLRTPMLILAGATLLAAGVTTYATLQDGPSAAPR